MIQHTQFPADGPGNCSETNLISYLEMDCFIIQFHALLLTVNCMPDEDITFVMTGRFAVCLKIHPFNFLSSQELLSNLDHAKGRGVFKEWHAYFF